MEKKYTHGQFKHGGELWRKNLTPNMVEEAVDQLVYTLVDAEQKRLARGELVAVVTRLETAIDTENWGPVQDAYRRALNAYNILVVGNPKGVVVEEKEPPILEV